ncbi:MAG: alpha/beta hydrolase family protein [Allosphingosinicella sp.]|uniref:alpha/beta hydrolase family protein n=1 Tax=Allosphingosinicella sp. TaxID=2823234 RepID=UPI0039343BD1
MFKRFMFLAACAAVPALAHAQSTARFTNAEERQAQAQPNAANPAVLFGIRESVQHASLSPDGTKLVFIGPGPGRTSVAYMVDLNQPTPTPRPITGSNGNPERLMWCNFVSNERVVCRVYALVANANGVLVPFQRLFAVNTDGSNVRELGQRQTMEDLYVRQFDGSVIDWLPGESGSVLMSRTYVPQNTSAGTRVRSRQEEGLGVDLVNTINLRSTRVERPSTTASQFITDGRGTVRMMSAVSARGETGQSGSRVDFFYRTPGSPTWRPFGSYDVLTRDGIYPLAVDADLNVAYALKKLNGRDALYRIKLDGSMASELVHANDRVDVDGVVRASAGTKVIGVTFAEEKRSVIYFDPEYDQLAKSLGQALPRTPQIYFAGGNADASKLLIYAASDDDPGRYYVFDRASRNLAEIMLVRPDLENVRLANVRPVTYPAADGTQIPGYLTLPPGSNGRNLPAVVLPHGGPSARDEWGFDWLAQFLANQGYAVLQPNFRGSAGFGDAWLQQNGFRSWETSIGDVIAGGRWLAAQGIADPNRLGIVGWSYGGYAALQSAVVEPGLFKAVVAIAPVTDLQQLKDDQRDYSNRRNTAEFIGNGPHIRQGSPLQNVSRITAPVLLVHGDKDLNVRVIHSQRMDRELRAAGKRSELIVLPGMEHDLDDSNVRASVLNRIAQMLGQALGR